METFKQCQFERGNERTIGFIPSWAAKVGNEIELKDFGNGGYWKVVSVGTELNKSEVAIQSRVYKNFGVTSLLKSKGSID